MKYILALHDELQRMLFSDAATSNKHAIQYPSHETGKDIVALLNENPDKVMMDVNFGDPGSKEYSPILEVRDAMLARGYDISKSLLGVTGYPYLAEKIQQEHSIPVARKPEDTSKMLAFVS
jgi:hypothetical protein